ncbi:TatD family hydrolase [Nonlabens ponticola]|uniref:TatD family deoxyribonuclease n=1 Tax=Nonlabens ponticola TaxID=2496866 RepID=A0A3S9MWA3_9FLAO|nr:TatD family hydrolase [Nonlabens ponticola]AZQ43422.1 TatD family deoxyribonuclease [Nonlabens ponticola]
MILTDTHTHLYSEQFDEDKQEMIQRAMDRGVQRFFLPAIDASYTDSMRELKKAFPENFFLMSGLHPTHVKDEDMNEQLDHVYAQLQTGDYVAVGEIGIDLYWDKSTLDVQVAAFKKQIEWSLEFELPIVIHCRDAFDEVFDVLEQYKNTKLHGIFHCFTGTQEQAQQAIGYNMKLGIGGVVTFKNGKIDKFLEEVPIEHIVLETDAPYLSPTPHRGKRNESAYLKIVAQKVADIYGLSLEETARVTTLNSREVFGC